jgi:uncharacterized protein
MPGSPNPFQITEPVAPAEVIDREAETAQLLELAEEANNARLVAPRRFGKTSLVRRAQAELDKAGWRIVYVDLLGIATLDDVADRIERAYVKALKGPIGQWFTGLRRTFKPIGTVGGGPVPAGVSVDLSARTREALLDRLALPAKVHERSGERVHVVFDEFQELDTVSPHADGIFRSEIQHHGSAASYVFAGSKVRMMEMLFADRKRAFFGQTHPVQLEPLGPDDLGEYISDRFGSTGKSVTPEALGALLDLVQGHPQRAMVVAHALWNAADTEAGVEEWETARADAMKAVADELRTIWMGLGSRERQVVVALANGEGPYSRKARSRGSAVAAALDHLEGDGTIVRAGRAWRIVDPLLAEWVSEGRE